MKLIVDFPQQNRTSQPRPEPIVLSTSSSAPFRQGLSLSGPPRVSFQNDNEIRYIENLSFEYKGDLWFSMTDIQRFKLNSSWVLRTIKESGMTMAQFAQLNVADTGVFMGLEGYLSPQTRFEIRYQRQAMVRAVLKEQHYQRMRGVFDPDEMALICQAASSWSTTRSQIIALLHAEIRE